VGICPVLFFEKRALRIFSLLFLLFLPILGEFCGHLPTFCPLLKMDLTGKDPVFMRVFGPFARFYFYLIAIKNLIIYNNKRKKVGI